MQVKKSNKKIQIVDVFFFNYILLCSPQSSEQLIQAWPSPSQTSPRPCLAAQTSTQSPSAYHSPKQRKKEHDIHQWSLCSVRVRTVLVSASVSAREGTRQTSTTAQRLESYVHLIVPPLRLAQPRQSSLRVTVKARRQLLDAGRQERDENRELIKRRKRRGERSSQRRERIHY